jgi:hypothetical protein
MYRCSISVTVTRYATVKPGVDVPRQKNVITVNVRGKYEI